MKAMAEHPVHTAMMNKSRTNDRGGENGNVKKREEEMMSRPLITVTEITTIDTRAVSLNVKVNDDPIDLVAPVAVQAQTEAMVEENVTKIR
jgi:hypothetical protein